MLQGRLETEIAIENSVNEKLDSMPSYVQNWYYSMRAQDITIKSCRDYLNKVSHFLEFINPNISKIKLDCITDSILSKYFISIQTKKSPNGTLIKTSDSYRNAVWFALNNFFEYQVTVGNTEKNYMNTVKPKKNKNKEEINRTLLTSNDFKKMLCFIPGDNSVIKKRNKAILCLYMSTGMRKDALRQINLSDILTETNELVVIDKGDKIHTYTLNDETIIAINDWLIVRPYLLHNHITDALFISYKGERISSNGIYKMVTQTTEKALGKKLSPHKIRSGFCSILYEQTHDIEFVKNAVGHADISTTQRYIVTEKKEKEIASKIMNKLLG